MTSEAPPPNNYISSFERILLGADNDFLRAFFREWSPELIWRLRRLNFTIRNAIDFYIYLAWDPDRFFIKWFSEPRDVVRFRKLLDAHGGVVTGAIPFRFFDRHYNTGGDLEIIIRGRGLIQIGLFLRDAGYSFLPAVADKDDRLRPALSWSVRQAIRRQNSENPHLPACHPAPCVREFRFRKTAINHAGAVIYRRVRLRLLRVEPIRYILSVQATAVMNFMTGSCAVCIFPKSTFALNRNYMASSNHTTLGLVHRWTFETSVRDFQTFGRGYDLDNSETLTGRRLVGDGRTWVVKFSPNTNIRRIYYPFQILDWSTRVTPPRVFLSITDPDFRNESPFFIIHNDSVSRGRRMNA